MLSEKQLTDLKYEISEIIMFNSIVIIEENEGAVDNTEHLATMIIDKMAELGYIK